MNLEKALPCHRCGGVMKLETVDELRNPSGEIIIKTVKWTCHSCGAVKGGIMGGCQ